MSKRSKKIVESEESEKGTESLYEQIKNASKGLYYVSETDAEIKPFVGTMANEVSKSEILRQINKPLETPVEERNFDEIFERLTKIQDWYGEEETETAAKFSVLRDLLKKNLTGLKVFKVGKIELDIYFVGLDAQGILTGIKSQAVET
ncbi:MAG TPA: nuclease A inhibitor family protein [Pyrinomonadaceae bacterium]|jgi:uncharacterized protein YqgV (UPF0045/DUF77 family)